MANPNSDFVSTWVPALTTGALAVVTLGGQQLWRAFWARRAADAEEERKDEEIRRRIIRTADIRAAEELARVYARNDLLDAESLSARAEARLWEARARRVDWHAHELRHAWANERQRYAENLNLPDIPPIPLLEDPLT